MLLGNSTAYYKQLFVMETTISFARIIVSAIWTTTINSTITVCIIPISIYTITTISFKCSFWNLNNLINFLITHNQQVNPINEIIFIHKYQENWYCHFLILTITCGKWVFKKRIILLSVFFVIFNKILYNEFVEINTNILTLTY